MKIDNVYMNIAIEFSTLSHAQRKKTGAIIVKNKRIISTGYNGTPTGFDNTCEIDNVTTPYVIHAEANAILKLAHDGESGKDSTLYCTMSPCVNCALMIIQSGITKVIYCEEYRDITGIVLLKQYIDIQQWYDM